MLLCYCDVATRWGNLSSWVNTNACYYIWWFLFIAKPKGNNFFTNLVRVILKARLMWQCACDVRDYLEKMYPTQMYFYFVRRIFRKWLILPLFFLKVGKVCGPLTQTIAATPISVTSRSLTPSVNPTVQLQTADTSSRPTTSPDTGEHHHIILTKR